CVLTSGPATCSMGDLDRTDIRAILESTYDGLLDSKPGDLIEKCSRALRDPNGPPEEKARLYECRGDAYILLHEEGSYRQALQDFEEALRLMPEQPSLQWRRALALFHMNRTKECLDICGGILKAHPHFLPATILKAGVALDRGDFGQVI